jgi:hypothetical protein
MYKITVANDSEPIHFVNTYSDEMLAWKDFFAFTDWGFANEYSTVNIYTPEGKCYTKLFYREGRKVVTK